MSTLKRTLLTESPGDVMSERPLAPPVHNTLRCFIEGVLNLAINCFSMQHFDVFFNKAELELTDCLVMHVNPYIIVHEGIL